MNKDSYDIDALLREAAKDETREAGLEKILYAILPSTPQNARPIKKAHPLPHLRLAAAVLTVLVLLLISVAASLTQTVEVNGKTFVAFQNSVTIDGVTRSLGGSNESGALLRIEDTNQYVDLGKVDNTEPIRVLVFAPGASPKKVKNPDAVNGKTKEPESIAPYAVFPLIGDLVVREGPDTAYAEVGMLYSGQCVTKVGICGNWAILAWDGGIAYAFNAYLFDAPEELPEYKPVKLYATEPVNVRALPSSGDFSAVLNELQAGEEVLCTGSIGEWSQIAWNGQIAYVFSKYLHEGGDS